MVQDMLETEYYLSEVNGIKTHYRDAPLSQEEPQEDAIDIAHKLAERQPLVVVPIPFSSEWLCEEYSTNAGQDKTSPSVMKEEDRALHKREADTMTNPPTKRKALSTPDTSMEDDSMEEEDAPVVANKNGSQRAVSSRSTNNGTPIHNNNSDWWPAGCMKSNPKHCPVLAKLYYEQETSPRLRLNEVVEVVGVLSLDPMDADFSQQSGGVAVEVEWSEFAVDDFSGMSLPPPSLLPRLHVLCYNRVNLENAKEESTNMEVDSSANIDDRSFAINVLAKHIFRGNETAAEALLMALMSMAERERVSEDTWAPMKTPSDTSLGCASLNFILSSETSCSKLSDRIQQVLSKILPVVGCLDLSREHLGKTVVSPAKDESGRLDPQSPLQLPKGSALVINEFLMTEGRIEARAEETLRALYSLTYSHSVPYRFEGMMNYQFEADYRVIVLSKANGDGNAALGSKLLPCTLAMKLADDVVTNESAHVIPDEDYTRIRSYLAQCRCNTKGEPQDVCNVALPRTLLEQAQKDFIEKRAEYRKKAEQRKRMQAMAIGGAAVSLEPVEAEVGETDFHRWLTIARLQARSRLPLKATFETEVSEAWRDTLRLDEAMRS